VVVLNEIKERREFLEEMKKLKKSAEIEPIITQQIGSV
jgi:hypothetical protein